MARIAQYDITKMSKQEVFDAAVEHLLAQGIKSYDPGTGCLYDGDTICCAAAPFLPVGLDVIRAEGEDWRSLVELNKVPDDHQPLMEALQSIHDIYDPEGWREELQKLASGQDLTYNEPKEIHENCK